ncbi:uncharacterized protein LOC121997356 [Zingiber officinale]|uniref:C2H2-type domain-containing protein n=1 Tax=Zingiber officinale TaxID=94328 RepID=A0A8J5L4P7_ZINOF|nr:uncharacterized protein LOC121997356 [Zingiber officinale]KAG6500800.1 hypothetical protein ZIOFF_040655 [Zingiber officinale]
MASFPYRLLPLRLPFLRRQQAFATAAASRAVAVFWDLDNKPPKSIPPYDAAVRLHLAAASFGPFRFSVAYANHHAFRHVPAPVRSARAPRRAGDRREAASPSPVRYLCRVCGRRFYVHANLINHFHQIHKSEQEKRLRRIESAKGGRRVRLVGALSLKMQKYEKAARELLNPEAGYCLADELRRAGVVVRTVEDIPVTADRALKDHMMETMDRGKVGCLMLVSDDAGFLGVIREARTRGLKTVVVGHEADGVLRRCADASLLWKDVVSGKAKKAAPTTVGKWVDKDLLKKLEWRYEPEEEVVEEDEESNLLDDDSDAGDEEEDCLAAMGKGQKKPWWKLDSDSSDRR